MIERRALVASALAALVAGTMARGQEVASHAAGGQGLVPPPSTHTVGLWPDGAIARTGPPLVETLIDRSSGGSVPDRAVFGISNPRLVVFKPAQPNASAVLVIPGGGYRRLVVDREGFELAEWLSARGYTAFVLFHRLPADGWSEGPDAPLADAQRAMRIIRHHAAAFGIDAGHVAALGFSAGGHVCADLAARFAWNIRPAIDAIDALSARPDAAAPIYPVVSMDPAIAHAGSRQLLIGDTPDAALEQRHSPERNVPADAPPHFLLHAEDDPSVQVENSLRLRAALRARGVPVRMHLFESGGHGFGISRSLGKPVEGWPDLLEAWLRTQFG
jgi:acetyl esterase/lipase